jgi:hypothetical protein
MIFYPYLHAVGWREIEIIEVGWFKNLAILKLDEVRSQAEKINSIKDNKKRTFISN